MDFPPDIEGQENAPLSADDIMDIIYHSMPTTWKNTMIEQGINYENSTVKEMSDFFKIWNPKNMRNNHLKSPRKINRRKPSRKEKEVTLTQVS